jgi:hypothetical protein
MCIYFMLKIILNVKCMHVNQHVFFNSKNQFKKYMLTIIINFVV